ncbi:hypothetical protein GCM10012319_73370 [Comamonas sp. KCTC 72670]|nr:hypothetical protein GCM10012319_73370 [Comamonas sp. KCTC 72670]
MGIPERHGVYLYEGRGPRLIPQQFGASFDNTRILETYLDDDLTRAYGRWCARKSQPVDCLRLLADGPLLGSDGKYSLAMAIAMDSVWAETAAQATGARTTTSPRTRTTSPRRAAGPGRPASSESSRGRAWS